MKWNLLLLITALTVASAQPQTMNGIKICIDPGHGGANAANDRRIEPDPGNVFWESEGNFRKALWLRPMLQGRGATVYLTRETNTYPDDNLEPSLSARVAFANDRNVHYFHSIHSNATGGTNTSTNRTMVLIREKRPGGISSGSGDGLGIPEYPESKTLADLVGPNIVSKLRTTGTTTYLDWTFYGGTNGGFSLGVLRGLTMPGDLSEGSFHDYSPETRRLLNNDYRKMEAYGLANAFVEFLQVPYDTLGIIAGTQKNGTTPINNIVVRLMPLNKVYNGDAFNNGFFLFDSLPAGSYKLIYETPGYAKDSVLVTINATTRLATVTPKSAATGVARTTPVVFTFIRPMDTAYVRSVFTLTPSVPGTITWNPGNTVMTFTPAAPLAFKTSYTASLAGMGNTLQPTVFVDNKTISSNVAAKALSTTFQTVSLPPYVTLTQPAPNDTNFSVSQTVGLRFSETMDTASVRAAFQIVPALSGSFTWTSSGMPTNTLIWKPLTGTLAYQTQYTVTIGNTAKSILNMPVDGNKDSVGGDPFVLTFRTQRQPVSVPGETVVPAEFALHQNFPNPFNPSTTIRFAVPADGHVRLDVTDMLGRTVARLVDGEVTAGEYNVQWDASAASSGTYFYTIRAGNHTAVRRMVLIR
ncbi:MAG: Ig-like domain-containing protein [Bacteroidetes bacterium]|nr:Ig-like domain-containing protein [Bacteroidota bacterium]